MRLMRIECPAHLTVYGFITEIIFGESLNYKAHHYATLSILPLPLCCAKIFGSARHGQTLPVTGADTESQ
jgi:hypothetical protein